MTFSSVSSKRYRIKANGAYRGDTGAEGMMFQVDISGAYPTDGGNATGICLSVGSTNQSLVGYQLSDRSITGYLTSAAVGGYGSPFDYTASVYPSGVRTISLYFYGELSPTTTTLKAGAMFSVEEF
jgi:hypothetical protein